MGDTVQPMAYESTTVPVDRSQGEIRKLLIKYGAQRFSFHEGKDEQGREWAVAEFVHAPTFERPHLIRIAVPFKEPDKAVIKAKASRSYSKTFEQLWNETNEQEARRIWRVLFYILKSRMESVAENVETFEQAFLPHIVDPSTGRTIWEFVKVPIERGDLVIGGPGLKALAAKNERVTSAAR
jgi:hypothetical protein